eukprot:826337-Amphidinium_carterae.1
MPKKHVLKTAWKGVVQYKVTGWSGLKSTWCSFRFTVRVHVLCGHDSRKPLIVVSESSASQPATLRESFWSRIWCATRAHHCRIIELLKRWLRTHAVAASIGEEEVRSVSSLCRDLLNYPHIFPARNPRSFLQTIAEVGSTDGTSLSTHRLAPAVRHDILRASIDTVLSGESIYFVSLSALLAF